MEERSSTGLDANVAAALAYLLFFVSGILLLLIERNSGFVRFHARQSTLVFATIFLLDFLLGYFAFVGFVGRVLLAPAGFILWLLLMFRAYQGEKYSVPIVGRLVEQKG